VWPRDTPELQQAIQKARATFVGRYLVISQVRELDFDGYGDSLELVMATDDLAEAQKRLDEEFTRLWQHSRSGAAWVEDPEYAIGVVFDSAVAGVRVIAERGRKVKDGGYNADTRVVQILEIDERPTIGEPLFRAMGYAEELYYFLLG
jgi:hypothetical protein